MKDTDASWLAAAIDGEGWIWRGLVKSTKSNQIGKVYPQLHVGVCNTNKEFVQKASILLGGFSVNSNKLSKNRYGTRPLWRTEVRKHEIVQKILEEILPFLIIKKDKALQAIDFIKSRDWKRRSLSPEQRKEILKKAWITRRKNMGVVY